MQNRDVFLVDPLKAVLPNDGVARVGLPSTPQEWDVLRYELSSFVCEGAYRSGMERILSTYLTHLDRDQQPAAWVSGFYGSGKSHFVRVLEYLWRDYEFPTDHVTARGLVNLPADILAALRELSTAGRRAGGLWSAAMSAAGAGSSIRLALLAMVLRSAGLPDQFRPAQLAIRLKREGISEAVRQRLAAGGKELNRELLEMYVSTDLARALREVDAGFGTTDAGVREALRAQYPRGAGEISDEELVSTIDDVLSLVATKPGERPLTLLIVDELQQYIGDDAQRAYQVQEAVEPLQRKLQGRLLLVATGQSALSGTPQLQRLTGRFTVSVTLDERDVETVVRQVVLRKKPSEEQPLRAVLDQVSGEIDRQLAGSKIGAEARDRVELVPDYPLLPVRRRFWERVLRAVDAAGTAGQLRTQLKVVLDATRQVAERPLGFVVAGDRIYGQLEDAMYNSGVLMPELRNRIHDLDDGSEDGRLRARLCAAIFLIKQLPQDGISATGVRATAETLADLLVEDLRAGSAELRRRIPALLAGLVEDGVLMRVEQEYRLQTKEGSEWEADFQRRFLQVRDDASRLAADRVSELRAGVTAALREIKPVQGASRTPRKFDLYYGAEPPSEQTNAVPIWVRDEWNDSEAQVRQSAREAGEERAVIQVFLPRHDRAAWNLALSRYAAAHDCLQQRPESSSAEASDARASMQSRERAERATLDGLVKDAVANARIFLGGGGEVAEGSFRASMDAALDAALKRLFPNFALADDSRWARVVSRASQENSEALDALGYQGNAGDQPVCKEILAFLSPAGTKGREVRGRFEGAGFGWPQDAVDGALYTLLANGLASAWRDGRPLTAKAIPQGQIPSTDFRRESIVITMTERLPVRRLLMTLGVSFSANNELEAVPRALEKLEELRRQAGGDAPLPSVPAAPVLERLRSASGAAQFVDAAREQATLERLAGEWNALHETIGQRLPRWQLLNALLRQAEGFAIAGDVAPQLEAIRGQRSLLADPDPVTPLLEQIGAALRTELQERYRGFERERAAGIAALAAADEWQRLPEPQRAAIVARQSLLAAAPPQTGDDTALARSLETASLGEWETRRAALPTRLKAARDEAARQLEPQAVHVSPPGATLKSEAEVDVYLGALRERIMREVAAGRPVLI